MKEDSFEQRYMVTNIGRIDMPVTFALHTTFVEPECFSVPLESCQEKNEFHIPTGKYVSLNAQEKGYVIGSQSKGLTISGYYKSSGNEALVGNFVYSVSPNFDHWILFNGKGNSNLLCIEPQCGAVNGLNIKDGCKIIKPGEKIDFWTKISKKADA